MPPPAAPRAVPASRSGKRASTCRSGKGASTPAPAAAVSADEVGGTDDETETAPLPAPDDATAAPTSPPTPASAPTPAADDEDGDSVSDDDAPMSEWIRRQADATSTAAPDALTADATSTASTPTPAVANDSVYGGDPPPADVAPATAADDAAANDNNNDALTADALDIGMAYDDLQRRIDRRLKEVAAAIEAKEDLGVSTGPSELPKASTSSPGDSGGEADGAAKPDGAAAEDAPLSPSKKKRSRSPERYEGWGGDVGSSRAPERTARQAH